MADPLPKGKDLFLGMLLVEIAFFVIYYLPCRREHLPRDTVLPQWQQGREAVGLVGGPRSDSPYQLYYHFSSPVT